MVLQYRSNLKMFSPLKCKFWKKKRLPLQYPNLIPQLENVSKSFINLLSNRLDGHTDAYLFKGVINVVTSI